MRKALTLVIVTIAAAVGISAQTEVAADSLKQRVVSVGPRTTYLKEGLRTEEVLRLLGQPATVSRRNYEESIVTTYEFPRGEGRTVIAEFVNDVLVRSWTERRAPVTQAN